MHFRYNLSALNHQYQSEEQPHHWKTTEQDQHDYRSGFRGLIGIDSWNCWRFPCTLRIAGSVCLWWGWTNFFVIPAMDVPGQWFAAWRHSELYTTFSMSSGMWINLMFSGAMEVVLKYHTFPAIINDPLLKRTMEVANVRVGICYPARWKMVFKLQYICIRRILTSCGQWR